MVYRNFTRDGQGAEARRLELLAEVARHQAIRSAREGETVEKRPFAAPGSFLVFIKRHIASGRFRPARPVVTAEAAGSLTQ
jgi:hypothetical protein